MDDDFAVTPTILGIEPQTEDEEQQADDIEEIQLRREALLAKASDSEGFDEIRKLFQERIEGFRKGTWIEGKSQMDDTQLGQAYRVELLVAGELKAILDIIDKAHRAVHNEKKKR